jgi:endonuclease/exonuclease/phosphatase family metal-dependent hydrolase
MNGFHRLRVLSYNIHKGFSANSRRFVLQNIKEAILALPPIDIIFLQEVVGRNQRNEERIESWPLGSQVEFLAEQHWPYFIYGSNASYDVGNHGNAVLSRHPIEWGHNMNISTNRFERRGFLHAKIRVPGLRTPLDCFCVHLDLLARGRKRQIREVLETFAVRTASKDPILLAGDFNDWSQKISTSLEKQRLIEAFQFLDGYHAPTFPSRFPVLKLDRIYTRGLLPLNAQVFRNGIWKKLSDHAPLYAEFLVFDKEDLVTSEL